MISYINKLPKQSTTSVERSERFEAMKKKIIGSNGNISHAAVLQLFHDRMNKGEGREIYEKLTMINNKS